MRYITLSKYEGITYKIDDEILFFWLLCSIDEPMRAGETPLLGQDLTYAINFIVVSAA